METLTSRERVKTALRRQEPDRVPADFLAAPEVWTRLAGHLGVDAPAPGDAGFFEPAREAVLRRLQIDCRVVSYDMFCCPPESVLPPGASVDWWTSPFRSTPGRMWRRLNPDGTHHSIWGAHSRDVAGPSGVRDEFASWPLAHAASTVELRDHLWPKPDWWDFRPLPGLLRTLDEHGACHVRFRAGSIFETAWQLRGLEAFLMDLAAGPAIAETLMDRVAEVVVENTRRVLELAGDRIDMIYFYDDIATQTGLMISPATWRRLIRPRHARLIDLAHAHGKPVMYHCDGAVYPLIPDLIDLGVDVLNPIQPGARGMDPRRLKDEFGDRLAFHGGIDIAGVLPGGTPAEVAAEVRSRVDVLGKGGGYVLCGSHHVQPGTPVENVLAMLDPALRYRSGGESAGSHSV